MQANNVISLYSEDFGRLTAFVKSIDPPYTLDDINGFNSIYRRIYPSLNRDEKLRSEVFVDMLINNLERNEWAAKIWGVV